MKIKKSIILQLINLHVVVLFPLVSFAQFAGPVGNTNTSAVYKDSSVFVNWANECTVQKGYKDIANTVLGFASVGSFNEGIGKAGTNGVVSLGDGGFAILRFQFPIKNGVGFDFAIFENSFNDVFLELAFVEVSSDGVNYFRFPATSNMQTLTQIGPFDNVGDATTINNLAGKYPAQYGTPFNLQELKDSIGLDVNNITHVKIIDVVGSINPVYASYDINANAINDPYPTAFASGGFDLDAVGVIHQNSSIGISENELETLFSIYPNPSNSFINILDKKNIFKELQIFNTSGVLILESSVSNISIESLSTGLYFAVIETTKGDIIKKKIIKQ